MVEYLNLADFLIIGGAVLDIDTDILARATRLPLADSALAAPGASFGGEEFFPDFHAKVAVLGWHLIRNHPLPDGNKRSGFLAMVEFVERNGFSWKPPPADSDTEGDETVEVIEKVAAGQLTVEQLSGWIRSRIGGLPPDDSST